MNFKLIAIGNTMMADEGIAVKVAELIKEELEFNDIKVFLGETDVDYCLALIADNDFIILLDATYLGITPGTVTTIPIEKYNRLSNTYFAQHDLNILKLLSLYNKNVSGYIIGIEVASINFESKLSAALQEKLLEICLTVKNMILSLKLNKKTALDA